MRITRCLAFFMRLVMFHSSVYFFHINNSILLPFPVRAHLVLLVSHEYAVATACLPVTRAKFFSSHFHLYAYWFPLLILLVRFF
jgi:hypothetical protein